MRLFFFSDDDDNDEKFSPSHLPKKTHSTKKQNTHTQLAAARAYATASMAREAAEAASAAAKGNGASSSSSLPSSDPAANWVDRFGASTPRKGADILVQALEREGVTVTFGYPGGASLEIHQALTRSDTVRNILCRHEQGEVFAAEGYAKTTGDVGVCIATSGPGATNLVTGLADALLDSVPLVAVTGQVPRRMIGTDAFQETPIVEVTRQITKHNYLVMDVADLPRVMKEAFFLARTGRPGPVLVDVPKDVQQTLSVPDWGQRMAISGYVSRLPAPPALEALQPVVDALKGSKRPVLYCGGGCLDASPELREFVRRTRMPVAQTLMGLGVFPESDPLALQMLGMHGTVAANAAVDGADLLVAVGVRFDDRVTGKLEAFASRARIVHIDVDPAEIGKNKHAHVALTAEARPALQGVNALLEASPLEGDPFAEWRAELEAVAAKHPLSYPDRGDVIVPQRAIEVLHEETKGEAIVSTVREKNVFRITPPRNNNKKNSKRKTEKMSHSPFLFSSLPFFPLSPPPQKTNTGRGPAPDVGSAVVQVRRAPQVGDLWGARGDGLWPPFGPGSGGGPRRPQARQAQARRRRRRRRRLVRDEHPGARHGARREARRESDGPQQPAPRHGGAVGGQVLQGQPRAHLPGQARRGVAPDGRARGHLPRLCGRRQGLWGAGAPRRQARGAPRGHPRDARHSRSLFARCDGPARRARAADDPRWRVVQGRHHERGRAGQLLRENERERESEEKIVFLCVCVCVWVGGGGGGGEERERRKKERERQRERKK